MNVFAQLWDHLWQSTLFAVLIWCLVPLFRDNSARFRYGLWFAASLKFLVPFSLLAALGRIAFVEKVQPQSMAVLARMRPVAMPFSAAAPVVHIFPWMNLFLAVWLAGVGAIAAVWLVRRHRLAAIARAARPVAFDLPIPVRSADRLLEPGLVGIRHPVILLPEGIVDHLSDAEIDAILRHELCHWRRRDNLLAGFHMLVACIFWFHPLVWFVGARLMEERERTCDEAVLAGGGNPLDYASTILKVCKLYLRSPLPCAAGVSGADLDRRITAIMARNDVLEVGAGRKALLMTLALVMILPPFFVGGLKPMPALEAARSLARVLMPVAPATTLPGRQAMMPSTPAHRARRHSPQAAAWQNAIEVQQAALVAPVINAAASVIIVPTPQLEVDSPAGEPQNKVCRPPQQLANSRLMGPEVCLSRQAWDRIRERGLFLMPDGRTLANNANQVAPRCSYAAGTNASSPGNWAVACY